VWLQLWHGKGNKLVDEEHGNVRGCSHYQSKRTLQLFVAHIYLSYLYHSMPRTILLLHLSLLLSICYFFPIHLLLVVIQPFVLSRWVFNVTRGLMHIQGLYSGQMNNREWNGLPSSKQISAFI